MTTGMEPLATGPLNPRALRLEIRLRAEVTAKSLGLRVRDIMITMLADTLLGASKFDSSCKV